MIPVASPSSYCGLATPNPLLFSRRHPFRVYRRRRIKPIPFRHVSLVLCHRPLPLPSALSLSVASLSAAVLAVSAYYYNDRSRDSHKKKRRKEAYGKRSVEWILYSSPTPFNRFVFRRCPSVSFHGDADEKLVTEDRHFVRVDSGVVGSLVEDEVEYEEDGDELEYQRVCIGTGDGGVVSIDWPESLDLREEKALDTTVVVVPGTTEGSMDLRVRGFVREALRHGFFPVVVNPRGCASSPITTARLFTAADSDDISTAIQFISKARPWTTLMAVGWGFGANVLTKYLAEVGERTPLTAATCVNNPFDLEEATRSSPYNVAIDEELAGGLVDILRANKELFQGKTKGFDVEKALDAKSVREFEQAISMVSYGFDAIEDFYSTSSTRDLVGYVKIPVLFIQNDDGTVPMFSIPRSSIAENPYTSLLICSSFPSGFAAYKQPALSWFRNLIIEWLMAVELGLLKGRHPLLKDVDVTINPVKGLSFLESRGSSRNNKSNKLLELTQVNSFNGYAVNGAEIVQNVTAAGNAFRNSQGKRRKLEGEYGDLPKEMDGSVLKTDFAEGESLASDERGQVLQSARVVMNMLDVTMPGTLTADKKQKVLTAVSQGETIMKAFQDAVPDDVRDKLTNAVSVIVKTHGSNLKLDGILDTNTIPKLKLKPTIQKYDDVAVGTHSSEQNGQNSEKWDAQDGSSDQETPKDNDGRSVESEPQSLENLVRDYGDNISKDSNDAGSNHEIVEYPLERPVHIASETNGKSERYVDDEIVDARLGVDFSGSSVRDSLKIEEESGDSFIEQSKITLENKEDESQSSSTLSEILPVEKGSEDDLRKENKGSLTVMDHPSSNISDVGTPSFSVSHALDALTGMDDSTQVAVNSVFGVLEEMIVQLEESSDDVDKAGNELNNMDMQSPSRLNDATLGKNLGNWDGGSQKLDLPDHQEITSGPHNYGADKERTQPSSDGAPSAEAGNLTLQKHQPDVQLVNQKVLSHNIPTYQTTIPYQKLIHNGYMQRCLLSLVRDQMRQNISKGALPLDYHPEEGQWKLVEEPKSDVHSGSNIIGKDTGRSYMYSFHPKTYRNDDIVEPSYVIVDYDKPQDPAEESMVMDKVDKSKDPSYSESHEIVLFVKKMIQDCLEIEVGRRRSTEDLEEVWPYLAGDFELVAAAVSTVVGQETVSLNTDEIYYQTCQGTRKNGILRGERLILAISDAVRGTVYLKQILPIGVIVGSCLAALRKHFEVTTHESEDFEVGGASLAEVNDLGLPVSQSEKCLDMESNDNGKGVVGVVAAALGTSALLAQQQVSNGGDDNAKSSSQSSSGGGTTMKEAVKLDETSFEKDSSNIMVSLAEKAMSVAGPVVPTKEDGELDQDKLVALLADIGQKGGMLKLVGKLALLWGGLRGAMSLTDRLISFLHIAERPLIQRMIAFVAMVLVLWSPVVVPLLPTLVLSGMSNGSAKFAELACIIGIYIALMMLVMLWGKRIRGYEKPLQQYGLDLTAPGKAQDFLKGFVVGALLVYSVQYANYLLGFVSFSRPAGLYLPSLDSIALLKVFGEVVVSVCRAIATATSVALVEELLFRSWLPEEIAADLGYHQGIIWSGLAYALFQRSPWAIPGLWLLSFGLAGLRDHKGGSLTSPIGVHTGIMVTSFILQAGGLVTNNSNLPLWMTGTHPFQPFSGVVGLAFSLVFAVLLYPRNPLYKKDDSAEQPAS
ncbi:hypothetical protein MLD38_015102 [Melastoma candidum]|uniref:Uncharacterized protein n=1 Tax=Melastoma candidum TaxID=119954 RepID=A0ACB9REW9_9MYRT|nr:hypothetical protein MLD38_015102 [Melastoma candidum]